MRVTQKTKLRLKLVAVFAIAAIGTPGLAKADHLECTGPDCPSMIVAMDARIGFAYTDTPSPISFEFSQADESMPVMQADYFIPKGWKFAVGLLRQGENSSGGAAASCADIYSPSAPTASAPRTLLRGEGLGGNTGMKVAEDGHRPIPGSALDQTLNGYHSSAPYEYGYRRQVSDTNRRFPSVSLLSYDSGTGVAQLCYYLQSNEAGSANSAARAYLLPAQLIKLPTAHEFGWQLHIDLSAVYKTPYYRTEQASILQHTLGFDQLTAANWTFNPTTGQRERVVFSRTPSTPGTYEFRGVFRSCAQGFSPTSGPQATSTGCIADDVSVAKTVSESIAITLPARGAPRPNGILRGPVGPQALPSGYGFIQATQSVTVPWNQAVGVPPDDEIKGYVVTVGEPNNQDSRFFRYLVTNPTLPGFNASVCGADGNTPICNLNVSFPNSGIAKVLTGDDIYDVSLITVYKSGARTDGLCDNGTAQGTQCDPAKPHIPIASPGVSSWRFMVQSDAWPDVFIESQGNTRTAPLYMLLVNFSEKRGRFVIFNPPYEPCGIGCQPFWHRPAPQVFTAYSNGIQGVDGEGGIVTFGGLDFGKGQQFRFDGKVDPVRDADGVFYIYDPQYPNLGSGPSVPPDPANPFPRPPSMAGHPTLYSEPFRGIRI
ncbi:MAG TPA: hypothetical protein VM600_04770 [Actinomycetota bacterium]|nr:hypothetical protein [Actinomycetota bacterium]